VITTGKDANLAVEHLIDQPMFFIDPLGPASGEFMLQRFRLSDTSEWIALRLFDEAQDA
jgi:hypothetical protein